MKSFAAALFSVSLVLAIHAQPLQRVPNNTLTNLPAQPPVFGYALTNAFGTLTFTAPIAVASPPGETNRLFVLERAGLVTVITNLSAPNRTVFMNIANRVTGGCEEGLLGIAFHPGYATNRQFFLFYSTTATTVATGLHQRVSRFESTLTNANVALTNTELPLITQYDEACNHNGGCLQFGPDGYLYASFGDEGMQNDFYNNTQRIDKDYFSGIIRIDVNIGTNKSPTSLVPAPHPSLMGATNYFIPADNPWVGATQFNGTNITVSALRAEWWAVGLRNPWRFSFDPATGTLYCGDVGGGLQEEVDVILKGRNYGWAFREGNVNGPKTGQTSPAPVAPINAYSHCSPCTGTTTNQGNSITGGVLYRGTRISQLTGQYIFADYSSGNLWALTPNGTNAVPRTHLLQDTGIAGFGTDPRNGDVLACDISGNQVKRLIYSTNITAGAQLPQTLAATGAFTNLTTLTPNPGIVPYDLNTPFWSDGAIKTRWFSVPNTNLNLGFSREDNWTSPTGTVWIKHFELELTNGVPASRQRLETRCLVRNVNGVYGITYRWGTSTTNAALVAEEGMDESFTINDGGTLRTQVWHYPSRSECLTCHTAQGGWSLGFNTAQLNREMDYGGGATNQIGALSQAGYFNTNVSSVHTLRSLAHPDDEGVSLEYRVRSYLAANCVQCHQPGGSAVGNWDARITTTTPLANLVDGPLVNNGGDTNNRVFKPGSPTNSVLLSRISTRGAGQMPPLASTIPDAQAIALLHRWITNDLPAWQTFADWQLLYFSSTNTADAQPDADPDFDGAKNNLEFLTHTSPTNAAEFWTLSIVSSNDTVQVVSPQTANRAIEIQSTSGQPALWDWQPLDVAGNEPFFSITNRTMAVPDATGGSNRFYRARIFAP